MAAKKSKKPAPPAGSGQWKPVCAIVIGLALTIGAGRLARYAATRGFSAQTPTRTPLAADFNPLDP
ncbi:MAG: hypothetical protein KDA32_00610 [Phycisphaerales bacterium]|nr:hypothetical protein [Phycisphaerales bacterium]